MEDLEQIFELSSYAMVGLTTLPRCKKTLRERIEASQRSFDKNADKPGGEIYFFVMEDLSKKVIAGTCAIIAKVGGFEPFYTYKIETVLKESKRLKVHKEIQYLQLVRTHSGPTEIGTLFLKPEYRSKGTGRMLSLCRFLFIAEHLSFFEDTVIAELRGVIDDEGRSPFWEALGRHFFDVELKKADVMGTTDKSFIEELIPQHPVYIPLLPREAQEVIGKVHKKTGPALHLLEGEGFRFNNEVDIFEAGPVLAAARDEIRTVRESREAVVSDISDEPLGSTEYIIANVGKTGMFYVALGTLSIHQDKGVTITSDVAEAINISLGGKIRFAALYPEKEN